ncbi:MAG: nucleotide exchange factor GrpE [Candidatus Absconditabacterales bacterium]
MQKDEKKITEKSENQKSEEITEESEENKENNDDLLQKMKEAEKIKDDVGGEKEEGELMKKNKLQQKIIELETSNKQFQEIAKKAQYDYLNLKLDFDRFQRQIQENSKNLGIDLLLSVVKKFLPFLEDLRKSLENITPEHQEDPLSKGVKIVYEKFLKTLQSMNIYPIESIGLVPDSFFHEPVSMQSTENKKLKGKIVQEFERGFYYQKDGEKKVITHSKVIIGE